MSIFILGFLFLFLGMNAQIVWIFIFIFIPTHLVALAMWEMGMIAEHLLSLFFV
jgi:hypothetical protein